MSSFLPDFLLVSAGYTCTSSKTDLFSATLVAVIPLWSVSTTGWDASDDCIRLDVGTAEELESVGGTSRQRFFISFHTENNLSQVASLLPITALQISLPFHFQEPFQILL